MPITSYTASGDNRYQDLTDLEKIAEQNRQRVEDNLLRMHLQDKASGEAERIAAMQEAGQTGRLGMSLEGQRGLQADLLAGQERMGGTFADKTAAEQERMRMAMAPQMGYLTLAEKKAAEEAALNAPKRARAEIESGILNRMKQGLEGGASPVSLTPELINKMVYRTVTGEDLPKTKDEQADELVRSALSSEFAKAIGSGDLKRAEAIRQQLMPNSKMSISAIPPSAEFNIAQEQKAPIALEQSPVLAMKVRQLIKRADAVASSNIYASEKELSEIKALMEDAVKSGEALGVDSNAIRQAILAKIDSAIPGGMGILKRVLIGGSPLPGPIRETRLALGLPE